MAPPDPLTRRHFQELSRVHLRAARVLLNGGHWQDAYHLTGFAAECGLKACVARGTRRYDFPRRNASSLYTHDLKALVAIAKLEAALQTAIQASAVFDVNWATAKDWTPESRYDNGINRALARDLYRALTARQNGVMRWIRLHW